MKKFLILICYIPCHFVNAQKPMLLISGIKEFELMAPISYYGISAQAVLSRLYIQGQYNTASPNIDKFQKLNSYTSFSYRVGIASKNNDDGNNLAFYLGYRSHQGVKKLTTENSAIAEYPTDNSGKQYEVDRVLVDYNYTAFCLGLNILNITSEKKALANKLAVVRPILNARIEFMYATNVGYNRNITYSPYSFYVPRDLQTNTIVKAKKFGMSMRFETAPIEYLGFIMEMGVYPGLKQVAPDLIDLNLNVKFGVVVNLLLKSKK